MRLRIPDDGRCVRLRHGRRSQYPANERTRLGRSHGSVADFEPDWDQFEFVYIGTPWDYMDDAKRFLGVLEDIDRSRATARQQPRPVRWNLEKTYLRELES